MLAGIPSDPSLYNPVTNPKSMHARRREVLQAMLDQKDIAYNEFRLANRTPLPKPEDVHLPGTRGPAQYFVDYVKQQLVDRYGTRKVFGGGLKVKTTIDLNLQEQARQAIAKVLNIAGRAGGGARRARPARREHPRDGRRDELPPEPVQPRGAGRAAAGLVVQAVRARVGARAGDLPSTVFTSKPVSIDLGDKLYYVHNYEGSNLGPIDLTNATIFSDNTVYAQLTQVVQPKNVVAAAHKLGITSPLKGYFSIALGGEAVNPLEMARAYAAFANGGKRIDGSIFGNRPRVIESVERQAKNAPKPKQVIGETNAEIVTSILQQVVQQGTGKRAQLPDGRPVAGKTGTTENYGDAWFVGYTPQLVTAVWVGYPNKLVPMLIAVPRRRRRGRHVPGGDLARVQQDGAAVPEGRPRELPGAERPGVGVARSSSSATARTSSTTGSAGTRSRSRTSRGARRRRPRTASRTRSRCRTSSATRTRRRGRGWPLSR